MCSLKNRKERKNTMFINELLNTYNAENVEHLVNVECFKLQHKIYKAYDERDTRCAMLANLSVTAQQLANRIASDNDVVASAVISKGEQVNGISSRFRQMAKRRGKHNALVRSVQKSMGGNKFQELVSKGALTYTAEYYVLNYARDAVNSEHLSELETLVSNARYA
jgi:hypothetical protein